MRPTERARGAVLGAAVLAVVVLLAASAMGQTPPLGPTPPVGPTPAPLPTVPGPRPGPTPRPAVAALGISMQGPARATVGQDLPYQITITNTGGEAVQDISVT